MYEAHFRLTSRPFGETVDPSAFVALPSREAILRRLRYGLEHGQGPVVVFGPSGVGKTLLAKTLAQSLGSHSTHLTFPTLAADELIAYLADQFPSSSPAGTGIAASLRRLQLGLASSSASGQKPLLIVDEAHLIDDPATFETLRLLLNFASGGPPDLSLVLVGGPELPGRLPESLGDRLAARCAVGSLSREESSAYVLGRLASSGASRPLFDADLLRKLHLAADGVPRRLNRLADLALLIAFARDQALPDNDAVALAAREVAFDLDPIPALV